MTTQNESMDEAEPNPGTFIHLLTIVYCPSCCPLIIIICLLIDVLWMRLCRG